MRSLLITHLIAITLVCLVSTSISHGQSSNKARDIQSLAANKSFDQLLNLALSDPDAELRRQAVVQLMRLEGDTAIQVRLNLYRQTADAKVKTLLIDNLARTNEIESLMHIASWDQDEQFRLQALRRIKYLKENSDSPAAKDWDVSLVREPLNSVAGEAPPPPPPAPQKNSADNELTPVTIPGAHLRTITSNATQRTYDIYVRLPTANASSSERKYPVLYLLDGQWDFKLLDSVYGGLLYDKYVPEMIIVGITYSGPSPNYDLLRGYDYTPVADANRPGTGDGPKFLSFLKSELIPFIEKNYAADPNRRVLMGSSLGGLFALYAMFTDASMFSAYVAASPAVLYGSRNLFRQEIEFANKQKPLPVKLFISVGEVEVLTGSVKEFISVINSRNYQKLKLESRVIEGERHAGNKPEAFNRGLRFVFRE
jgi:uncharacterized protein